jgi:SAM-dependent methyltransferase
VQIPWKIKSKCFRYIDRYQMNSFLYFCQRYITRRASLSVNGLSLDWERHRQVLQSLSVTGFIFEFGAGKSLAQNLYLSAFVDRQLVVDINPMANVELIEDARQLIHTKIATLRRAEPITSLDDLQYLGISYAAPYDASSTGLPSGSVDACISTNTLEHIPAEQIEKIFNEVYRVLRPAGVVSAIIDYSDHYAHTDETISLLNFLKFDEQEWESEFNHKSHYQNRLRHYDYIELFNRCGFKVLSAEAESIKEDVDEGLADKFKDAPSSWSATSGYFVLIK